MRFIVTLAAVALVAGCAMQPAYEKGRYLVMRSELTSNIVIQMDLQSAGVTDMKPELCGFMLNMVRLSESKGKLFSCTFQGTPDLKAVVRMPVDGADKPMLVEFRDLATCREYARDSKTTTLKEADCQAK